MSRPVLAWLSEAPTTELRIITSIVLAVVYVFGTMLLSILDAVPDGAVMVTLGGFLLTMMGLDVAQYGIKRATYKPSPPNTPDIENMVREPEDER